MYQLYFDGGCGPNNPGGIATFGCYVERDGETIFKMQGVMDETETSSNVAEYGGLISGLTWLLEEDLQNEQIVVIGDSKLVISQMFHHWRIKKGLYVKYARYCKKLLEQFDDIQGKLVPRALNEKADGLTRFWSTERILIPSLTEDDALAYEKQQRLFEESTDLSWV